MAPRRSPTAGNQACESPRARSAWIGARRSRSAVRSSSATTGPATRPRRPEAAGLSLIEFGLAGNAGVFEGRHLADDAAGALQHVYRQGGAGPLAQAQAEVEQRLQAELAQDQGVARLRRPGRRRQGGPGGRRRGGPGAGKERPATGAPRRRAARPTMSPARTPISKPPTFASTSSASF